MVDEEQVGVFGHEIRGEEEAALTSAVAKFDLKVRAAIEALGGKLLIEWTVKQLWEAGGCQ